MTARVLIVDDHAGFRQAAMTMLVADGMDVVGEAIDGASAVAAVAALHPDVVLLDVGLPGGDGISWCPQIASAGTSVVLISSRDAADYGARIEHVAGAVGFVTKADLSAAAVLRLLSEPAR